MKLALLLSLLFVLPSCQEERKRARPKAQNETESKDPAEKEKKTLLNVPAGAVIEDLVLPYNDDQKKVSLLTIKKLTVADDFRTGSTILAGHNLKLWLFDDQGNIRSTTTIANADYLVDEEELTATSEVLMIGSDGKFAAKSKGGIFSLATGQAVLLGPATTKFRIPPKKEKKAP